MKIFNTMTKKKEEFIPLEEVCMYADLPYITLSILEMPDQ